METKWIDNQGMGEGCTGFLVRISHTDTGAERYELRDRPPHTNQSGKPMPRGWCGSHNNTSTFGEGVWEITKVAPNGRTQITEVTNKTALFMFLDEYGYPDLLDECLPPEPDEPGSKQP